MMSQGFWQRLLRVIGPQSMVSAPAVWGKLPEHGDFVYHRSSMAEREAWQNWAQALIGQQSRPADNRAAVRVKPSSAQRWVHLEPQPHDTSPSALPVAFVLPPGMLPFALHHYVQGVVLDSHDKVGRPCPFVIYQCASPVWMRRLWGEGAAMGGQDLLFWWARLAVRVVHGHTPWSAWLALFEQVWQAHAPGWQQLLLGGVPRQVPAAQIHALLGPPGPDDPAYQCVGVEHLPWVNWPEQLWQESPDQPAFWTQDEAGRYVQASHRLSELWS